MRARDLLCWLLLIAALAQARRLHAESVARVVIVRPAGGDKLLNEALIRTRGELRAVGLTVEVQLAEERSELPPDDSIYGSLVFRRSPGRIEIDAFSPGVEAPVSQLVDTGAPGVDAEVVSVRAVEALRAAMLQYAKRARASDQALPEAVVGFTKLDRAGTSGPAPASKQAVQRPTAVPARAPAPGETARAPEPARSGGVRLQLWLGPELSLDVEPALPSVGGRLAGFAAWRWFGVGAALEHGFSIGSIEASEGSAGVQRTAALAELKAEFRLSASVRPFVTLGAGARRYRVSGSAAPGYTDSDALHWSALGALDFGSSYRLFQDVGAYLSMGARLAVDAPQPRFAERRVAVLERPSVAVSGGIILGPL